MEHGLHMIIWLENFQYTYALEVFIMQNVCRIRFQRLINNFECSAIIRSLCKMRVGTECSTINQALEGDPNSPLAWQERGVLKELMGNYDEALEDLNRASKLGEPMDDYEIPKHRTYVNFKLGHEEEARKDAEKALLACGRYIVDDPGYNSCRLGTLSVPQFLGFHLK